MRGAHPDAAAAGGGLHHDRIADPLRRRHRRVGVRDRIGGPRRDRNARRRHQVPRADLVAHLLDRLGIGADPDQAGVDHRAGEPRVLGQEPVAGMDGGGVGLARHLEQQACVQVALRGGGRADADGLVGLADVGQALVRVGVHGDGAHAHPAGGADDPAGDLAPVGDQN